MNPSDFDDDSGALSFSDLPPSIARQYAQFSRALPTQPGPTPTTPPTAGPRRPLNPGVPVTPIAYPVPQIPPTMPPVASQPNPVTGAQPMLPPGSTPTRPGGGGGASGPIAGGFVPGGAVTRPGTTPDPTGGLVPVPVEQYQQGNPPQQLVPGGTPERPKDNSTLMFIGAAALLAGLGYWAYSKMEKDKRKMRVGPPSGQTASFGDDDDGDDPGSDEDDGEPGGALDAYEGAGLDPEDVDPHEEGGIKLVKG